MHQTRKKIVVHQQGAETAEIGSSGDMQCMKVETNLRVNKGT